MDEENEKMVWGLGQQKEDNVGREARSGPLSTEDAPLEQNNLFSHAWYQARTYLAPEKML